MDSCCSAVVALLLMPIAFDKFAVSVAGPAGLYADALYVVELRVRNGDNRLRTLTVEMVVFAVCRAQQTPRQRHRSQRPTIEKGAQRHASAWYALSPPPLLAHLSWPLTKGPSVTVT